MFHPFIHIRSHLLYLLRLRARTQPIQHRNRLLRLLLGSTSTFGWVEEELLIVSGADDGTAFWAARVPLAGLSAWVGVVDFELKGAVLAETMATCEDPKLGDRLVTEANLAVG